MDGAAILSSLTGRSPPSGSVSEDVVVGGMTAGDISSATAPQRKITLLTRPPAPPVASSVATATSGVASIISGNDGNPLISDLHRAPGGGGGGVVLTEVLPTPGRAARNDYYDTEDPSVNLHDFIVNSLQAQKNRVVLLKLEEEFLTYVTDPKRVDPLKLPPWDSYHRMLAHRVAAYFGLEHNVDPVDKSCVVVCKGPQTRVPTHRFSDFLGVDPDSDPAEPKLILKRSPRDAVILDKSYDALSGLPPDVKTFEEREEEYEKTRARIFNQQQQQPLQGSQSNIAFDLANAPQTPRSSLLPAIMQHRRTVSDTLLFRRPSVLEELKKDGPSSSHSSRSATPLIALLQPGTAGEAGIVGQSMVATATGSKVTPQHSPQQQKVSPREIQTAQQVQVNQQHNAMRTQNKFQRQRSSNVATSFPFQPVAGRGLPVFYPHQQAAAVMADPSWYYNNMMLYQMPPQQYIQAVGGANPYSQMIPQPAIFPQYPVSPAGVVATLAQSPVVSPPISTPRPGFPLRLPMVSSLGGVVEGNTTGIPPSPPHLPPSVAAGGTGSGISLVRPVAQVATPPWGSFKFESSPSSSVVQPGGYAIGQPVGGAMVATGVGGQTGRPLVATGTGGGGGGSAGQLAEHMEQLALEGKRGGGEEMRLGQIGECKKPGLSHEMSRNGKAVVNGSFPTGYAMMSAIEAGQMMSPTQVHHPTAAALSQSLQFLPAHIQHPPPHMIPGSPQEAAAALVSPQHVPPPGTPGGVVHFPGGVPNQSPSGPTTPTIGHMGFPPNHIPGLLPAQQQQSIFSPPTTGGPVTHSPVQILGHTLGTSLFSPPPATTGHPAGGMFVNSPTTGGKVIGGYPAGSTAAGAHAPVGSGLRFRRYESPKQGGGGGGGGGSDQANNESTPSSHAQSSGGGISTQVQQFVSETSVQLSQQQPTQQQQGGNGTVNSSSKISSSSSSSSSGFQPVQLPPRLASQQTGGGGAGVGGGGAGSSAAILASQRNVGNRYQNQRHPANRSAQSSKNGVGGGGGGNGNGGSTVVEQGQYLQLASKKEPLLPTPPNTQMVKLDTILTCGVPLHVMEIVSIPPDGTQERQQAYQMLRDMGAVDITGGRIAKTGEEVLVACFSSPEVAIKALQVQNVNFTLSIPRNNHAKFILSLIANSQLSGNSNSSS